MSTIICPCCGNHLELTVTFQAKPPDADPFKSPSSPAADFPKAKVATKPPVALPHPSSNDTIVALLEQCEERSNLGELNEFEESFVQNTRERLTKYGVERLIMTEKQTKTLRSIASGEKKR